MTRYLAVLLAAITWITSPAIAATNRDGAVANKQGVVLLNNGKYRQAVEKFHAALRIEPNYPIAKANLAIAELKLAIEATDQPWIALSHLHKAYLLESIEATPRSITISERLNATINKLGYRSADKLSRLALAHKLEGMKDYTGAAAQYLAALRVKEDPNTREALTKMCSKIEPFYLPMPAAKVVNVDQSKNARDSGEYMRRLSKRIKLYWHPPKDARSHKVVVGFTLSREGLVEHVAIKESSGFEEVDETALEAIRKAEPFETLPAAMLNKSSVEFEFTFSKNSIGISEIGVGGGPLPSLAR